MTKLDDMDLMQYFDGELSPVEAARVSAQLANDVDGARKVESLGQIREGMQTFYELAADDAEPQLDGMWDRIERRIQANGATEDNVLSARAPARKVVTDADRSGGIWAAIRRWFNVPSFATGAVAAGAVAALILFLMPDVEVQEVPGPERIAETRHSVPAPADVKPVSLTSSPPAVEELNVTEGTGYIFTIPGEDGETDTTVIWIEPEAI